VVAVNDLETELRDLLHSRASRAAAGAGSANLLAAVRHRIRRRVIRRRAEASILAAVAVAGAAILPLTIRPASQPNQPAVGLRSPIPLTDVAATPAGWVPVPQGDAQISVPKSWELGACDGHVSGVVLEHAQSWPTTQGHCRRVANVVKFIASAGIAGRDEPGPATRLVNGIAVRQVAGTAGTASYLVPSLHVELTMRGPLAAQVLSTLTRSPLSVVLSAGRPATVPAGWRWYEFGGVRLAAPAKWPLDQHWGSPCQYGVTPATVIATRDRVQVYSCPAEFPAAGSLVPEPGVEILAGPANPFPNENVTGCFHRHGLSICTSQTASSNAVLQLRIRIPGVAKATDVLIGLAGSGITARTIYDSIGPVRGSN
jgi:hypothetical protein